jgi:hypothetical protein
MSRGGQRPGAGRPKGSLNKRSFEEIEAVKDRFPDWTPLMHLATVANDADLEVSVRLDAAKTAAPYFHAKPKPVEIYPEHYSETQGMAAKAKSASNVSGACDGLAERLQRAKARRQARELE